VIGVVGPYDSSCAISEIAITNRHGPLAIVSPANSFVGLTQARARPRETCRGNYPPGRRVSAEVTFTPMR
jgi:hypothetical protein